MSEPSSSAASGDITITVKGPSELKLSITIDPSKPVSALKEEIASKSEVEKDRQRLIYSGKVLKDEDPILQYKIQNGHTIHMVKGAAKAATPAASSSAQAQRLPQMGTGLNVAGNPVDSIENIQHGLAGFNPFAGMQGMDNLNDPNAMANMMQNDDFLRSMSEMMARPEIVEQIIASNPQLAHMAPQIRQTLQNPMVRQMMSNPDTLRSMMQMQSAMNQGGGGGMGGMGGMGGLGGMGGFGGMGGGFNPFGAAAGGAGGQTGARSPPTDPFPNLFAPNAGQTAAGAGGQAGAGGAPATGQTGAAAGQGGMPPNPFAGLFGAGAGGAGAAGGANPFGFDPAALFGGGSPFGAGAGGGASPWAAPPRDTRPPEEMYATQLGQLNAMGLWDAQKNIRALRSTGGNVEAAIELIFSGQMDQPGAQ